MPPKVIITKDLIIESGIKLCRMQGYDKLNARSLAAFMACSTKPLFRSYKNMDELKTDLFAAINRYCSIALLEGFDGKDCLQLAMNYINFAKKEPNLFKALFMNQRLSDSSLSAMLNDNVLKELYPAMAEEQNISLFAAQDLFQKTWLFSHGMAAIIAANDDAFAIDKVQQLLKEAYIAFLLAAERSL